MTVETISQQTLKPVLEEARLLYRKCKSTDSTEYIEVSREIKGLHIVLKRIRRELNQPESPLNRQDGGRDAASWQRDLHSIVRDCIKTLERLSSLLKANDRVPISRSNSQQEDLGTIRSSLISLKTNVAILLDAVQLRESARNASVLQNQSGQLDIIREEINHIAARMNAQKSDTGSVLTTYDDDDKEVWKQFRRELVAEGFDSDVLSLHKDVLRAYIKQIAQDGVLRQDERDSGINTSSSIETVAWLRGIQEAQSPVTEPHEMQCVHSPVRERYELPDNRMLSTLNRVELNALPHHNRSRRASASQADRPLNYNVQARPVVQPLHDNSDRSNTRQRRTSIVVSQPAQILDAGTTTTTLELFNPNATSRAIDIPYASGQASQAVAYSPGGSPSSHKSYASYMERGQHELDNPNATHRSINGAGTGRDEMPHIQDTPSSFDRSSQRPVLSPAITLNLAPDQNGNPIPANAKWTKVKRSQVSPAVLAEDNRRYEVRREFIAVLGILSREQIQDYATRTLILRQSRARPPPHPQQSRSATYPQLPNRHHYDVHGPAPSSDDDSDASTSTYHDSDTESSDDCRLRRKSRRNRRHGYRRSHSTELSSRSNSSYTCGSMPSSQNYAQPWLHPQAQPYHLGVGVPPQASFQSPYQLRPTSYTYVPPPQHRHSYSGESSIPHPHDPRRSFPPQQRVRFEDDEIERSMNSRRPITNMDDRIQSPYGGQPQQAAQQKKKSSWKSALTGTTLGVAAGSMLGVLFETAQDLDF